MEGNGPIQGTARPVGVVVVVPIRWLWTPHAAASWGWSLQIGYLQLTASRAQLHEKMIPQSGERIADVTVPFGVLPKFEFLRLPREKGAV